jgi:hypothetical protein
VRALPCDPEIGVRARARRARDLSRAPKIGPGAMVWQTHIRPTIPLREVLPGLRRTREMAAVGDRPVVAGRRPLPALPGDRGGCGS